MNSYLFEGTSLVSETIKVFPKCKTFDRLVCVLEQHSCSTAFVYQAIAFSLHGDIVPRDEVVAYRMKPFCKVN